MQNTPERPDDELRLKDVTEADSPPNENVKRGGRKKKLVMLAALGALLIVTAVGGYFLLAGREVQVKPGRKAPEKITSGADLQKAAYDSLRGLLGGGMTEAVTSATNIGLGQPATAAMAGGTPSPVASNAATPKTSAPAQPGIALTLAPPVEAAMTKQSEPGRQQGGRNPESASQEDRSNSTPASRAVAAKPRVGASIAYAMPPNGETKADVAAETKASLAAQRQVSSDAEKPVLKRIPSASAPGFGAMLPVRSMGVLYTLRAGSLARFELARDVKTGNQTLRRGTVFVGSVLGSDFDRAYVQIKGFIDPETNGFTRLEGETLGSDGGAGLRGKRRRVSPVWVKVLDRAAQSGTQILTGVLGRRDSSVIIAADPYGTYRSGTGYDQSQLQGNRTFVEVPAGSVGFVLVTTLPEPSKPDSHLAVADWAKGDDARDEMPEAELAELLAGAEPEKIREAMPRMSPELRRVAQAVLKEIEPRK
jgi:hypothetical protein